MKEFPLTIIIPARNEENNIKECLYCLLNQSFVNFEIIIVDDQSNDKTNEICKEYEKSIQNIRLIELKSKPENWIGKNFALYNGYEQAKYPYILFMDADVRLNTDCITTSMNIMKEFNLDILSYAAYQECISLSECSIQPLVFSILNILFPLKKMAKGESDKIACNGIFIMVKKDFYESIGTHEAVKLEILEDVKIAQIAKSRGGNIKFLFRPDLIKVRMYTNFKDLFEGWSKNFYALTNYNLLKSLLIIFLALSFFWLPLILGVIFIKYSLLFFSLILINLILYCINCKKMGYSFLIGILYPFGSIILVLIIINSIINFRIRRNVRWKGRIYQVK